MGEPIELPAFITEVPEASINKQEVSNEVTRTYISLFDSRASTATNNSIFVVPDGFVLELSSAVISMIAGVAGVTNFELFISNGALLSSREYSIAGLILDHAEHQTVSLVFNPLSVFIDSQKSLRVSFSGGNNNRMVTVVNGFLIKKSELGSKLNIFI